MAWLFSGALVVVCLAARQVDSVFGIDVGMLAIDSNGDLSVTPPAGRTVLVQGVDVPASLRSVDERLRALELALQIESESAPAPTTGLPAAGSAPHVSQDHLGNMVLIPATNRTLVVAGVRVLEMLTRVGQRLLMVESRIRLDPNVTMALPPATAPLSHPGMIGLGADGNLRIESLPGATVLAAGRNLILELHLVSARLNLSEQAMASCPSLTPPATCRLCIAEGCKVAISPLARNFSCICNSGLQGRDCRENQNECASGAHGCSANATCADTAGSFACTCNVGFEGDGVRCADIDECKNIVDPCTPRPCENTVGSFTCITPTTTPTTTSTMSTTTTTRTNATTTKIRFTLPPR